MKTPEEIMAEPLTIDEVRESILYMRKRLESGQGDVTKSMCRLSLRMSEFLMNEYEKVQCELATIKNTVVPESTEADDEECSR